MKIQTALEAAGVVFIDENGGGAGVGLRKPRKDALMEFTVVSTAEWHREFIADFAPQASLTPVAGIRLPHFPHFRTPARSISVSTQKKRQVVGFLVVWKVGIGFRNFV